MNIKDYSYIVEIAEQKNLTTASERLCITQSALTKFVQRIEQELGTPLFYRRGKRFLLTPIGQIYVEKGKEIIRSDQALQDEIQKMKTNGANTIRLGYGAGTTDFILERLLPVYYSTANIRPVSIYETNSSRLISQVENGELDICLAYASQFRPALNYTVLKRAHLLLAVPQGSPLLDSALSVDGFPYPVLNGSAWMQEPYIHIAASTRSGARAQDYFRHLGKWPNSRLYVKNVSTALGAVARELGNSIVAEPIYVRQPIRFLCLPDLEDPMQQICMVTLKGAHLDYSLKKMQETIMDLYSINK